tara:strand:+ start:37 stop:390 length:354 start_codon:yes stop_codon:yes gene_type:complete
MKMNIFDKIKDAFSAEDFDVKGQTRVKTVKKMFFTNFGCQLRIYHGKKFADDNDTLASIRPEDHSAKVDELTIRANWKVSEVESKFMENFGIKVQVANTGDTELADNDLTLGEVSRL